MATATPIVPKPSTEAPPSERRWMVVAAGVAEHRIELSAVREVAPSRRYTALPGTPDCILGLANLRGRVVTVVDLSAALGGDPSRAPDGRVVVVSHGERGIGLAVDEVVGIDRADEGLPPAATGALDLAALLEPLFG